MKIKTGVSVTWFVVMVIFGSTAFADENWQCQQLDRDDFQCYNGVREYACRTEKYPGEAGDNVIRLDLAAPYPCPVVCSVVNTAPSVASNDLLVGGWVETGDGAPSFPSVAPVGAVGSPQKNGGPRTYEASVFSGRRVGEDGERGQYWGMSAEWRGTETEWMGRKVQVGPFVDYSAWQGKTADGYHYNGDSIAVGASAKMFGNGWDVSSKAGIGSVVNEGGISRYDNRQIDRKIVESVDYTNYEGRNAGEKWLPEWSVGAFGAQSLNADRKDSWAGRKLGHSPDDTDTFGVRAGAEIMDIPFGDGGLSIAPTVGVETRYADSNNRWTNSIGPGVALRNKNAGVLANVGLPLDDDGGTTIAGGFQLGAMHQAYRASQIVAVPVGDVNNVLPSANTASGSAASGSWFPTQAPVSGGGWYPTN